MTNEEKILSMLETLVNDVATLKQGQINLEQGQAVLEREVGDIKTNQIMQGIAINKLDRNQAVIHQKVTKIEVVIENDVKPAVIKIAESHLDLDRKLDNLKDLNEQVVQLKSDTSVHKAAIKELARKVAE